MEREVVWTSRATESLARVLEYLGAEWPRRISDAFIDELTKCIEIISIYPELGRQSPSMPTWRHILVTRQNALVYRVENDTIILLDIIDTRSAVYYSSEPF